MPALGTSNTWCAPFGTSEEFIPGRVLQSLVYCVDLTAFDGFLIKDLKRYHWCWSGRKARLRDHSNSPLQCHNNSSGAGTATTRVQHKWFPEHWSRSMIQKRAESSFHPEFQMNPEDSRWLPDDSRWSQMISRNDEWGWSGLSQMIPDEPRWTQMNPDEQGFI